MPKYSLNLKPNYQRNPHWKKHKLGNKHRPEDSTIGKYGCLLSCYCDLATYATGVQWTPPQLDYLLCRKEGWGYDKGNQIVHSTLAYIFEELIFHGLILCGHQPAPIPTIDTMLPCVIKIDFIPGGLVEPHWVLAKEKVRDDYIINDPWTGDERMLLQTYGKPGWDLARIILTVVRMDTNRKDSTQSPQRSAERAKEMI